MPQAIGTVLGANRGACVEHQLSRQEKAPWLGEALEEGKPLPVLDKKQTRRGSCPPTGPRGAQARLCGALTRALVCSAQGQGAAIEAPLAALAVGACRVVQAAQAVARQGVAVAHGIGVHIPTALAPPAGLRVSGEPQRVPKEAVVTDLAVPP